MNTKSDADLAGERAAQVRIAAEALGFDACGIAGAEAGVGAEALDAWLGRGFHADMAWMETARNIRANVMEKLPGAQSVIVVARNYYGERPPGGAGTGRVARYAWGADYHRVLKKPLVALAKFLRTLDEGAESYASVDSGPVLERAWAERSGVGWIGKNSLVLRRDLGSWFFLGTVITTLPLAPDAPVTDHCGSCRACIDACPTDAIVADGIVDARRCISYLTIENRGEIGEEFKGKMGDWVFGCDICQEVCPWNHFARETTEAAFRPRPGVAHPDVEELLDMDVVDFDARFAGTPVRRAKHSGMQRNAQVARENEGRGDS